MRGIVGFVYGLLLIGNSAGFDPCTSYTVIHEPERSTANVPAKHFLCDRLIKPGWTRFRDAEMPFNTCIKPYHCGTHVPIWLQGNIPTVSDGIVEVTACADMTPGNGNCCEYTYPIRIKNCGGFLVYDLLQTVGCSIAYCAGTAGICTGDKFSRTGFEPCVDAYPKLTGNPVLGVPKIITGDFKFTCHIPYPAQKNDADFTVTWLIDGNPIVGHNSIHLHSSAVRDVIITGDNLHGQLGKSLSCSVTTSFSNNRTGGIVSPPWQSNTYWIGVKYASNSIHLEPTGQEKPLELISTIPVVCKGSPDCSVHFHIETDKDGVMPNDCTVTLKPTDWNTGTNNAKTTVHLRPRPNQPTLVTTLTTKITNHHTGAVWNSLLVAPVSISVSPGPGARCSMTGDPHVTTFDAQRSYYMSLTGQFTAVRTRALTSEFRVDIRTWRCGHAVCICGVMAREGNDVVGLDLCHGRYKNSFPKFLIDRNIFTNKTLIQHDNTGRNYVFKFPSGGYLKAQATKESSHINAFIQIPESMKLQSEGLCGFFDRNSNNDLTDKFGRVHHFSPKPVHFSESWRITKGQSLFEKVEPLPITQATSRDYCNCSNANYKSTCSKPTPPDPPMEVLCPNCHPPVPQSHMPSTWTTATPTPISGNSQGVTTLTPVTPTLSQKTTTTPPFETYNFTYETMPPLFPTSTVYIPQPNASAFCDKVIASYKPARDCIQNHYNLNVTDVKEMCVEDLMWTGNYEMAISALTTLVEECGMELLKNNSSGLNSLMKVCPGACAGNGQCVSGTCHCNIGFGGSDCSIQLTQPPKLKEIIGGHLCDVRYEECHYPTLVGENIKENTTCVLREIEFKYNYGIIHLHSQEVQTTFGSTNHVHCQLPRPTPQPALSGFSIGLKSGGKESSELPFTMYNSKCISCSSYQHCVQTDNTCLIKNQCYSLGQTDGLGGYCNPARNKNTWSYLPPSVQPVSPSSTQQTQIFNQQSLIPHVSETPETMAPSISTPLPSAVPQTAPLGGLKTPRDDIWTKQLSGCSCSFDPTSRSCACCEVGAEQCPKGDMCVQRGDLASCGTKKPSDTYGEDYWTATYTGCGCLFDFSRADCACCQNQGCPCSAANRNQCADCLHSDRCGKKPWIFGPDFV